MGILSNETIQYTLNLSDQSPEESDVIPQEDPTDITPFLFPAIGALLMLVFGGLLFSSGATPCKIKTMPGDKFKRQFERQHGRRTIRFHNVPERIAQEPCSVLQQENNDIVDAVRKEYQDLPQYQPVSGLVGNIMGLHGQTCVVNVCRPEVIDRSASPIHSIRNENTSDYDISSCGDKESEIEKQNDAKEKRKTPNLLHDMYSTCDDNVTQRIPSASSGIGTTTPDSFEADSLEEYPLSENGSQLLDEAAMPDLNDNGCTRPLFVQRIDRGVYAGGRLSVLQLESAPSCLCVRFAFDCPVHGTKAGEIEAMDDVALITNERLTWGDIAQNANPENLANLRLSTPSADVSGLLTTRIVQERGQSPLRRGDLEKWLNDVEASRKASDGQHAQTTLESNRRVRAPLQESLQLLKRLQLVSGEDLQLAHTKSSVQRGGRTSCLETVRAPSSLCLCAGKCHVHSQIEIASGQLLTQTDSFEENTGIEESTDTISSTVEYQCNSTRTKRIARGGRLSSFNQVRASSDMCIHGPSCQFHCQKTKHVKYVTETGQANGRREIKEPQEVHLEVKELRGASSFGEVKDTAICNTTQEEGINYCSLGQRGIEKAQRIESNPRGASSLGCSTTQQTGDQIVRGASSFALEPLRLLHINHGEIKQANDAQSNLEETRGASCFAPLDESIVDTSSVTLSIAVESDGESFAGCRSSHNKESVSTSNVDAFVNGTTVRADVSKISMKRDLYINTLKPKHDSRKKFGLNVNNNSSGGHPTDYPENHAEESKTAGGTELGVTRGNAHTREIGGQRKKPNGFDERILKVGKDATMMSTLLNALRRVGEQKGKETLGDGITKSKNRENNTNERRTPIRKLKFSVFYKKEADNSTPLLYVSVVGLEGVSEEIITPLHSAFVKLCLFPKFTTWRRTKTVNISGTQLVLKDHFIISGVKPVDLENAILRFSVVCTGEHERVIGQLEVPLSGLKPGDKLKRTCALHPPGATDNGIAE